MKAMHPSKFRIKRQFQLSRLGPIPFKFAQISKSKSMKFTTALLFALSVVGLVSAQDDSYRDYGIVSPPAGTTISQNTPLNLTFAPHRYFKESPKFINVFLINGTATVLPTSGINTKQVVFGMTPNIQVTWSHIPARGYQVNVNLKQLSAPVPGERTVFVKETYNAYGGGEATSYWYRTFSVTA
ncbi:hypothetical protein L218DRAFT_964588 [Marasmius fiardii PR-910]|nr:hypothetical protein L218DRAFT_964588 [Marasmius fiardii PR-910]